MILPLQDIRDLLPAAVMLADPQVPNQPLAPRGDLARPSGALLGLGMAIEKAREPLARHALQPEPDGLPMSPQMRRNLRVTQALRGPLKGQGQVCEGVPVHRVLWTVGYLRQHCGPYWHEA